MPRRWPLLVAWSAMGASASCASLSGLSGGGDKLDGAAANGDAPTVIGPDAMDTGGSSRDAGADVTAPPDGGPYEAAESDMTLEATPPADAGSDVVGDEPSNCEDASVPILPAQNNATATNTTTTASVQLQQPLIAHDLLIVEVDFPQNNGSILSVTDADGNTFHAVLGPYDSMDGSTYNLLYAEDVATSGTPDLVTVTLTSSAPYIEFYVLEYRGIVTSGAFDVASVSDGSSGSASVMHSGAQVTSAPHELIFGFGGAGQATLGTGFTSRNELNDNEAEDRVVNCKGSYEATATNVSGGAWTMLMAAFRGY